MPPTALRSIQAGQSWAGQHCPEGRDWRDFPAMHFIFYYYYYHYYYYYYLNL